jgi:hypothetical protein
MGEFLKEILFRNDKTITYNFDSTILTLFFSIFSLKSDAIRFKNDKNYR